MKNYTMQKVKEIIEREGFLFSKEKPSDFNKYQGVSIRYDYNRIKDQTETDRIDIHCEQIVYDLSKFIDESERSKTFLYPEISYKFDKDGFSFGLGFLASK